MAEGAAAWCESVGPPILRSSGQEPGTITGLLIVSWNFHVGGGRVEDLLSRLWRNEDSGRPGTILLLEETYRAGEDVPALDPPDLRVPSAIRPGRPGLDVVALAKKYDLSLAYVPSMRNGSATDPLEREDRGNAILSTEPLSDARAIELPFGSGVSSFRPRSRRARVGRRAAAGDRDALDTTTGSPRPRPRDNPSPILERYHLSSAAI